MFKITLVYLEEIVQTDETANPREKKLYAYRNSNPGRWYFYMPIIQPGMKKNKILHVLLTAV
jgi:hypothetical protein